MLNFFEAREAFAKMFQPLGRTTSKPLAQALNHVLAKDYCADLNVPPKANSAMDGYAFFTTNSVAKGTEFKLSQTIAAGTNPQPLVAGTAARILTGAELPDGANTVVIQENVTRNGDVIVLNQSAFAKDNVRPAGQDITKGECIAKQGDLLNPATLGVLASAGIHTVEVFKPLNIALLNTGQELVEPGQTLLAGQIYNSNRYTLQALIKTLGMNLIHCQTLPDDLQATQNALHQCAAQCDLIITSGGVSVGDEDHVKAAISNCGSLDFWKVNIKPGKPIAVGSINSGATKTPIIGLPGNPVSAFITFIMFAIPALAVRQGATPKKLHPFFVKAAFEQKKLGKRAELARAKITYEGLTLHPNQSSGVLRSVQWADGLVLIPEQTPIAYGDMVAFYPFNQLITF